jgi:hypothetical protein
VGVALIGALFTSRLAHSVATIVPGQDALDPKAVQALPHESQVHYVSSFAHALAGTFLYVVPLTIGAIVLSLALRETPLRQHVHADVAVEAI